MNKYEEVLIFATPFQVGSDYILSIIYNTNQRLVDELHFSSMRSLAADCPLNNKS
jgi:outer membrane translocation and assembly module TamA